MIKTLFKTPIHMRYSLILKYTMINPNEKGTIYYGTDFEYVQDIDKNSLEKPRVRHEQYISVSISGYKAEIQCNHGELEELARVFSKELGVAEYKDKKLCYKEGYVNSLTCLHGFGPNPNSYYPSFSGLMKNKRTINTITAVISKEALADLVYPDESNQFEFLSLALHGFIKKIDPDLILGWIVHKAKANELKNMMNKGILKEREIWIVEEFETLNFDFEHRARYAVGPERIEGFIKSLNAPNLDVQNTCYEHLKNILSGVTEKNVDWNSDVETLTKELTEWVEGNQKYLVWNKEQWRYDRK